MLIDSPAPLSVDGLGGEASSNSKLMVVGVLNEVVMLPGVGKYPEDVDLVTVFA